MNMNVLRTIRILMNVVLLVLAILHIAGFITISPTLLLILATIVLISIFFTRRAETKEKHEQKE
ncbi:hypothetical protein JNO66_12770 [Bacillus gibsonii]|jgi:acyl-CoA synthetase (AMP-forming)/AMP-acid ligase II|uniref:Uncharacterized protein n=2 Tax=Alkalicoccobacillus gibsonii TaxID=79881 RepID=A0ABU9VDQ0_9BACI|nr:hypothetical protein [Alkalicoccobacillus gibsonii]